MSKPTADVPHPIRDGEVKVFDRTVRSSRIEPRIYYVNGINTDGPTHAKTATVLSIITEGPIVGVYNYTAVNWAWKAGILVDLLQCGADWADAVKAKMAEFGTAGINKAISGVNDFLRQKAGKSIADPVNVAQVVRAKIPAHYRTAFVEGYLGESNAATASLFRELVKNRDKHQWVVAHSQGNLITANALWGLAIAYGDGILSRIRIYSLASPAPAWPLGIRSTAGGGGRLVYGHKDDFVTLADPHNWTFITGKLADGKFGRTPGDWRKFGKNLVPGLPGLGGHDLDRNIALNFFRRIRGDLLLPPWDGELPAIPGIKL
jgi:hypothetical protein